MRVISLKKSTMKYSCNSYLILGDWNRVGDLNTVIDPGADDFILDEIARLSTGCGKVAVAQVLLTHNHFDHNGGVQALKAKYGSRVLAFADGPGVDDLLHDGQYVKAGDSVLEVIHAPGHSSDSVCLYAPEEKLLFSGDMQFRMAMQHDRYSPDYNEALARLSSREVLKIYTGHDLPISTDCNSIIQRTADIVRAGIGDII